MYETDEEIAALDALLAASHEGATRHLTDIVSGDHRWGARQLLARLDGMRVLSLATVTAGGAPRVSAVDGHFLHGAWTFGTDGSSAKARHLAARPAVSAAWIDGERTGFFTHGRAVPLGDDETAVFAHWARHYGSDPRTWGDDIRMFRIVPQWCVAYAGDLSEE
ncbi:pyridoxamine 5'-phosphate oxidase family protein [Microbacterium sp. ZXX196]|uniref:pyridoxamine 5'-phosphate oxidase family protein n=1 Tax=Microbacterium sp. ZXX196 TaxID=2609291 RepID=UPI0013258916|nr:pyridoxamine 5'-phosphate oxidase family protein [Microbacterium sp. ZXX196]